MLQIALPYMFLFSDNVAVPSRGLKAKCITQTIFGQKVFKMEQFRNTADSGSLLLAWKSQYSEIRSCPCKEVWMQQGQGGHSG